MFSHRILPVPSPVLSQPMNISGGMNGDVVLTSSTVPPMSQFSPAPELLALDAARSISGMTWPAVRIHADMPCEILARPEALPRILKDVLRESGWRSEDQDFLLRTIERYSLPHEEVVMRGLIQMLRIMLQKKWSHGNICHFVSSALRGSEEKERRERFFRCFPCVLDAACQAGWNFSDIRLGLLRIVETVTPEESACLACLLRRLGREKWAIEDQENLIEKPFRGFHPMPVPNYYRNLLGIMDVADRGRWACAVVKDILNYFNNRYFDESRFGSESSGEAGPSAHSLLGRALEGFVLSGWTGDEARRQIGVLLGQRYFSEVPGELVVYDDLLALLRRADWSSGQQKSLLFPLGHPPAAIRQLDVVQSFIAKMEERGWRTRDLPWIVPWARAGYLGWNRMPEIFPEWLDAMEAGGWDRPAQEEYLARFGQAPHPDCDKLQQDTAMIRRLTAVKWSADGQQDFLKRNQEFQMEAVEAMDASGWTVAQERQFLEMFQKTFPRAHRYDFNELAKRLRPLEEPPCPISFSMAEGVLKQSGKHFIEAMDALRTILEGSDPSRHEEMAAHFLRLLKKLTGFNRLHTFRLIQNSKAVFDKIGKAHLPDHFALYAEAFERWPRLGFNVMEGMIEATEKEIIKDPVKERSGILRFADETNGFLPSLYKAYLAEGDSLFPRLHAMVQRILKDEFSLTDARDVVNRDADGEEFLLGVIQTASPTSGASFVKKSEQLELLRQMLEAGDLRDHIPASWRTSPTPEEGQRDPLEPVLLTQGEQQLKAGEEADSDGIIRGTLDGFRVDEKGTVVTEGRLREAFQDYQKSQQTPEDRMKFLAHFFQFAGKDEALGERINCIYPEDYQGLLLLEQLFADPDNLMRVMDQVLKPPAMDERQWRAIVLRLFKPTLNVIRKEKAKYVYRELEPLSMIVRAVKGPAFGLHGLSSGVCTAEDLVLWKNPDYKLLEFELGGRQMVGDMDAMEVIIEGRRHLVLLGINPSVEFLSTVRPQELYDSLIDRAIRYARRKGYESLYLPANPYVHSNRGDIQRIIRKKKYRSETIPVVHWNTLPKPYPFSEVYVLWRAEAGSL